MMPGSILLYIHPPFYNVAGTIFFDAQAQNGLRLWATHFDMVRVMAPLVDVVAPPPDAVQLQPLLDAHPNIVPVMLPRRGTLRFIKDVWAGRRTIRQMIAQSQYLVFGFSGYIGDWGTLACMDAYAMGRPYGVFKDIVGHRAARVHQDKQQRSVLRKLRDRIENVVMRASDRRVVRRSALALLHGQDTMAYYSRFARKARMVHDIHISKADLISASDLDHRLIVRPRDVLRVVYAGRVDPMKGPDYWTAAISGALAQGVQISATWFGIGELQMAQQDLVASRNLGDAITFAGFVPHATVLAKMREADVFVFTHMTEESPRCLIEALAAGLPLVGFDSAYPRDLVGNSQAGVFVPRGDSEALTAALVSLAQTSQRLAQMSQDARRMAEPLNDADIFAERSKIIKELL